MKILVLVKEVPSVSDIRIDRENFTIDRSQAGQMMNPPDRHAVQAALTLASESGGTVTALSMGPEHCETVLREAIGMGANEAVRITDTAFEGADTLVTTHILKAAIDKTGPYDCIFCGSASLDSATGQIAAKLGSLLNIGVLTAACHIEFGQTGLTIDRKAGTGYEQLAADFPLICSVTEDANKPTNIFIKGRMAAKKAVIPVLDNAVLQLPEDALTSPSSVIALFPPAAAKKGIIIKGANTEAAAAALVQTLLENRYV